MCRTNSIKSNKTRLDKNYFEQARCPGDVLVKLLPFSKRPDKD